MEGQFRLLKMPNPKTSSYLRLITTASSVTISKSLMKREWKWMVVAKMKMLLLVVAIIVRKRAVEWPSKLTSSQLTRETQVRRLALKSITDQQKSQPSSHMNWHLPLILISWTVDWAEKFHAPKLTALEQQALTDNENTRVHIQMVKRGVLLVLQVMGKIPSILKCFQVVIKITKTRKCSR